MIFRKGLFVILASFLLLAWSGSAYAESLPMAGAVAQVSTTTAPLSWTLVQPGTSGSSSGPASSASIDLTTGEVRVAVSGTTNPYAGAQGFEFLTFSGSGTVSYSYSISGTMSNTNPTGDISLGGSALIYDVTGMSPNYFGVPVIPGNYNINAAPISFSSAITHVYGNSFNITPFLGSTNGTYIQSQDGTIIPVLTDLSGSFAVDPGHIYAISLLLVGSTRGPNSGNLQTADFSNTAAFQFTDLDGLTFNSSSGQFLANTSVPTPEPTTFSLLVFGLAGTFALRRRTRI